MGRHGPTVDGKCLFKHVGIVTDPLALPPGWRSKLDPAGRPFYWDCREKAPFKTQWGKPPMAVQRQPTFVTVEALIKACDQHPSQFATSEVTRQSRYTDSQLAQIPKVDRRRLTGDEIIRRHRLTSP